MSVMRRWLVFDALLLAGLMLALPFAAPGGPAAAPAPAPAPVASPAAARQAVILGHSRDGRPIRAIRLGDPAAPLAVLVVGCVHGNETAGRAVVARLARTATAPRDVALWLLDTANPDGCAAYTRGNAAGVDLNRNFPYRWQSLPRGTYYSGPRALSEPESRALYRFLSREGPVVSVWYHQHARLVDWNGDANVARRYARRVGLPAKIFYEAPGSITRWLAHTFPGSTGLVVELPAGSLSGTSVRRHADAVLALAREAAR
jgi:protein MpaA